jgi:peptidyl-prolyl cis-trans isomerase A (cyclophilin A)
LAAGAMFAVADQPETATMSKNQPQTAETKPATGDGLHPRVTLETTLGNIVLELDGEKAPISTKNFLDYAEAKFYDGLIFHRVMSTFMIQGGGYTPELDKKTQGVRPPIKNEWQNGLKNVRGSIAMARLGGQADSASCEFFINVVDNGMLDQARDGAGYAVFGKVVEGLDVMDKIKDTPVTTNPKLPMGAVVPQTPVVIKSAKVTGPCDMAKLASKVESGAKSGGSMSVEDFVKKTEADAGKKFQKTPSGLMYLVVQDGNGASPKATDTVKVHYTGTFLDGRKFDSSVDRGQPAEFPLNRVIKGWTEGVQLMKVGGKCKLVCPPELAYGQQPPPGIPPNSTLVFDIELLDIKGQ